MFECYAGVESPKPVSPSGDSAAMGELRAVLMAEIEKLRVELAEERARRMSLEARVAGLEARLYSQ